MSSAGVETRSRCATDLSGKHRKQSRNTWHIWKPQVNIYVSMAMHFQQTLLGHKKKIIVSGHNKILNWRYGAGFFFKSSESDDSRTIFSLDRTRLKTKHWCADLWRTIGAIKVTRYSIGALLLVAPLFVWSACKLHGDITWCYYVFRNQFRKYLQTIF